MLLAKVLVYITCRYSNEAHWTCDTSTTEFPSVLLLFTKFEATSFLGHAILTLS
jgi:hypothetical protein